MSEPLSEITINDMALAAKCKAQDAMAFDLLIERYKDRIFNYVRRIVNDPTDAEDIALEVFVKAYVAITNFDGRSSFSTWLFKIATNLCTDHLRKKSRKPETISLTIEDESENIAWIDIQDNSYNPERLLMEEEIGRIVDNALNNLSSKLKEVVILHDIESLSYEEIAQVVACPLGTVKSRLFLARAELQKAVRQYLNGGDSA